MSKSNTPAPGTPEAENETPVDWSRVIKVTLIALSVLLVAGIIWAVLRQRGEAEKDAVWDDYATLRKEGQPTFLDGYFFRTQAVDSAQRERYVRALNKFLEAKAGEMDGALEPHVRWRLAKTLTDHVFNNPKMLDTEKRAGYFEDAITQLETIKTKFSDWPLNWEKLRNADPDGKEPTLTRQFIKFIKDNAAWEKEHFPKSVPPEAGTTVVLRTTRGDLRIRLYDELAPSWTDRFTQNVAAGAYDGLSIFEREGDPDDRDVTKAFLHGARDTLRDAKPYDRDGHLKLADAPKRRGVVPEATRHSVLHERGTVCAWHESSTTFDSPYDDTFELVFVTRASPDMNYKYTPIGKIVDDASLEVLDAIAAVPLWSDDTDTRDDAEGRYPDILNVFQVPTVIVKALAFDAAGKRIDPAGEAKASRVLPTADEHALSALKADAYKKPVPERPNGGGDDGSNDRDGDSAEGEDAGSDDNGDDG